MTPEEFVSRLTNVKKNGQGKWMCSCPAHQDSDPSLAVGQTNTGKILLRCFAGCSAVDVVNAMGLKLEDLFPDAYEENPLAFAQREMAQREKLKADISYANTFLNILTDHLKKGQAVSENDIKKGHRLKAFLVKQGVLNEVV